MPVQLFISHTKRDEDFCDRFESMTARVGGLRVFRSEFEQVESPAWKTIKEAIDKSTAIFLLVGKELVKAQKIAESDPASREVWKYTHNWIAYEVGLACQQGKDVWVICDDIEINFPVPYLTHYEVKGINRSDSSSIKFWKNILDGYVKTKKIKPPAFFQITCPYDKCKAFYELRTGIVEKGSITCPTCLRPMQFPNGWPTQDVFEKISKYYGGARGVFSYLVNRILE
jgi:hypothetical protein